MPRPLPSRRDIVRCLADQPRGLRARHIAAECGVPDTHVDHLDELLEQLTLDGTLRRMAGNRFVVRAETQEAGGAWEGRLTMNARGFGFVTAVGYDDVFIPPENVGIALHGDRVRVSIVRRTPRGLEGRILDVVDRRDPRVAGVFRKRRKSTWLEPDDTRLRGPIVITRGRVQGRDGDAAVVEITRFPRFPDEAPEGELVAVLGVPGDPNTEVAKILLREEIIEEHPEEALVEAEAMAARLRHASPDGRVDLRDVPLPTIDPEDARDHDDALWAERTDNGYRAYIAIADVSEYVQDGSALDAEARSRGCTIYLPDRAIPMLPTALAADLCSLVPDQDRYCLCVIADLDKSGAVVEYEIVEGVMRSAAMLTYGGVARALGFDPESKQSAQADAMKKDLRVLDELSRKLRKARMSRGALDLDLPEPRVELDPKNGQPISVSKRAQREGIKRAYSMVEEMMLLANELVARWMTKRRLPAIYRVHGAPDEEKLERLANVAETLGVEVDFNRMLEPKGVSRWLRRIADHPKKPVLESLMLRSLKQASYDLVNIGHFGLASDHYLHFTSPIRRYPDLLTHRQIKALLRGEKTDRSPAAVEELRRSATDSSTRERSAMEVEREVVDLYRALYMREHVGDVFTGRVTAITGGGIYINLPEPFVDVLARYEALGPDRYEVTDDELSVVGARSGDTISLGDEITVSIEDVAVLRRTVYARRVVPEAVLDAIESGGRVRSETRGRGKLVPKREKGAEGPSRRRKSFKDSGEDGGRARPKGGPSAKESKSRGKASTGSDRTTTGGRRATKSRADKLLAAGRGTSRSKGKKKTRR